MTLFKVVDNNRSVFINNIYNQMFGNILFYIFSRNKQWKPVSLQSNFSNTHTHTHTQTHTQTHMHT